MSLTDLTFVSMLNLSVLNSYVNGQIVSATICQTVPASPLMYGSHSHCVGTINGFNCTPICDNGFTASSTLTCLAGVWSGASDCVPSPCKILPPVPPFGNVDSCINKLNGTICNPICNFGYANQTASVCFRGNWTGSPTCAAKACPTLIVPSNGLLNNGVTPITNGFTTSVVQISCVPGFALTPSNTTAVTCLPTSLWSTSPTCTPLPCPILNVPSNGLLNGGTISVTNGVTSSVVQFSCNSGYDMVGASSAMCQVDQVVMTWLPSSPTCVNPRIFDFTSSGQGSNWQLVRHIPASQNAWHPTAVYGEQLLF